MKRSWERCLPDVLDNKGHRLTKFWLDQEAVGTFFKGLFAPTLRNIPQTAELVTTSLCASKGLLVNVGGNDDEPYSRKL